MYSLKFYFKSWVQILKRNWLIFLSDVVLFALSITSPMILTGEHFSRYMINKVFLLIVPISFLFCLKIMRFSKQTQEIENLKNNNRHIKNENSILYKEQNYLSSLLEELPCDFLTRVFKYLNFTNSERISLYILKQNKIKIVGRFSENPSYDKINREEYPLDKGYISKCLKNDNGRDYYSVKDLPRNNSSKYFEKVSKESGMSIEELKKLPMKSRMYFIKNINNPHKKSEIGILVIESTKPSLNKEFRELNDELNSLIIPYMSAFLKLYSETKVKENE